jgi:hypothetical protein
MPFSPSAPVILFEFHTGFLLFLNGLIYLFDYFWMKSSSGMKWQDNSLIITQQMWSVNLPRNIIPHLNDNEQSIKEY